MLFCGQKRSPMRAVGIHLGPNKTGVGYRKGPTHNLGGLGRPTPVSMEIPSSQPVHVSSSTSPTTDGIHDA